MNKDQHPGRYLQRYMDIEGIDVTDLADASNVVSKEDWTDFVNGDKDLNPLIVAELCVMFDFHSDLWTELDRMYRRSDD